MDVSQETNTLEKLYTKEIISLVKGRIASNFLSLQNFKFLPRSLISEDFESL
jgi:hypothetical protein